MIHVELPIKKIGEEGWVKKLTAYLSNYDIEAIPLTDKSEIEETEERLDWNLPQEVKDFFNFFGDTEKQDFMYGLLPLSEFTYLGESDWEFVKEEFSDDILSKFIVFAESPGTDPICFNKDTNEIFLFSHDPVMYGKVYSNFNDYLLNELIKVEEFLGELEFESEDEKEDFMAKLLPGDDIDYGFRSMKLE